MPKPLVSFIVTTYNLPVTLLDECLNSILSLSLSEEEREIILIDDGSERSPIDFLSKRDDLIYIRQANQGLSVARNNGLQWAKGEYIQFVDGDDYLVTAPYEHCLDFVRYDQPDMVLFHMTASNDPDTAFSTPQPVSGCEYLIENNMRAAACGYIFRKEVLRELKFTPGIYHEDEEFTPQLLLRSTRVFDTNAQAYYYRQRSGSITHNIDRKVIDKRLKDILRVIDHLKAIAIQSSTQSKAALERRVAQLTMDYLYHIIVLTKSRRQLDATIEELKKQGLYPLPDRQYTRKYILFRKLIDSHWGRQILMSGLKVKR
jgi:glycosyltransferase involved in cell wall biosynthesis